MKRCPVCIGDARRAPCSLCDSTGWVRDDLELTRWPNLETLVWLVAGMGITIALVCA